MSTNQPDEPSSTPDLERDCRRLREEVARLQAELNAERRRASELEQARLSSTPVEMAEIPSALNEFEETLRRLVQRTAMIVQAEKCVILVRDRETGDLFARSPAWGMSDTEVKSFRVPANHGVTGEVFRSGKPALIGTANGSYSPRDPAIAQLNVHNGIGVPLLIEKRDDEHRVVDRITIGVLHCFNKRFGGGFIEEDVRLLERLSRNAAAVIANAQMYQEVVEEKQKLVHTLESLTAGLLLINPQGRIAQINAHARTMFGVSAETDPIGKLYTSAIPDECAHVIRRKLEDAAGPSTEQEVQDGHAGQVDDEITITDEDGEAYIYQVHAATVRDSADSVIGTVVIFNDITDIRNVERMKTEFVSIVSHELRTPLTPMKGFIDTLLQDPDEEMFTRDDRREFYDIIKENVDRLGRLINDLLNVSRIERLGPAGIEMNWEDVDLRRATDAVMDTQRGRSDKHVLVVDFDPERIVAQSDADNFQMILQNLVSNAIKYSPEGGEVRVIGRIEAPSEKFPLGAALVGVRDQGVGLSERDLKRLGEKFFRADNRSVKKVGGTGIGLFLVKNLVAAHHGDLNVESAPGKGSTFWLRIPLRQTDSEVDKKA